MASICLPHKGKYDIRLGLMRSTHAYEWIEEKIALSIQHMPLGHPGDPTL